MAEKPRRRATDDPKNVPPEETIMGEVLEQMIKSNDLKETMIFLVKTSIIVIGITAVLVVALQIQVWSRNKQIDQVNRIVCGFTRFIPDDYEGDEFRDCDRLKEEQ